MPNGEVARVVIMGDIEGDEWAKIFGKHVSPPEHSDGDCSSDEEEYDDEGEDEEMTAQFQGYVSVRWTENLRTSLSKRPRKSYV